MALHVGEARRRTRVPPLAPVWSHAEVRRLAGEEERAACRVVARVQCLDAHDALVASAELTVVDVDAVEPSDLRVAVAPVDDVVHRVRALTTLTTLRSSAMPGVPCGPPMFRTQ